jgi:hypothetical protein
MSKRDVLFEKVSMLKKENGRSLKVRLLVSCAVA